MKRKYTHIDAQGMRWRFEGSRPISELADEVMDAVKKKQPRLGKYRLDGEKPKPCDDLLTWAYMFESVERKVAEDRIGESTVSTVFLGLDHNFSGKGPPILWETMVFGGKLNNETRRCGGTKEQALAMHAAMVKRVKEDL